MVHVACNSAFLIECSLLLLFFVEQQSSMVDAPSAMLRTSRGSIYEARRSVHLGDGAELDIVPDLTNFRPVTLTVSSFFKQVSGHKIYFFFGSHLAPKYFKVVANSKKVGCHLIL